MKKKLARYAFFVLSLPGIWACQGEPASSKSPTVNRPAQPEEEWLEVKRANFQIREAPGHEARALRRLNTGEQARSLGEQSTFTSPLQIGGTTYGQPWLLVEMQDSIQGWVYALAFLDAGQHLPSEVRLRALLGAALMEQLVLYEEAFEQAHTDEMVIQAMAMGRALRDTLVEVLTLRILESSQQEDFFWLKEAIPAFVPHFIERDKTYYLFIDYRPFLSLAQASEGGADDALLELYLMAYPTDSVEYFYPAWVLQASEKEVYSLLGRGLYFRFLEKLDKLPSHDGHLEEEIGRFGSQLLNDMIEPNVTYWEPKEKAVEELEQILQAEFQVFSVDGQDALKALRLQFEHPEKYGIKFNYKSGIYNLK